MTYVIQTNHLGSVFHLRGTVWTSAPERATVHASAEIAQAALNKAKPFMKAATFKAAKVIEAPAA